MYYHGARYYWGYFGRWLAVDQLLGRNPSISPYAYCLNNPLKYHDPDGRDLKDVVKNPKVRSIASLGASVLAEHAAKNMKPGKARGFVNLAAGGIATFGAYESMQASIACYAVAFTTSPTIVGFVGGVAGGTLFGGFTYIDVNLATEYYTNALEDFKYEEESETVDNNVIDENSSDRDENQNASKPGGDSEDIIVNEEDHEIQINETMDQ